MVVGISMVRDEADIVGQTLRLMLGQVDHVIVADNLSSDGTRAILDEIAEDSGRVLVLDDPEPGYYQSLKMTRLAARAAAMGADWVVPFDADERWYSPFGRIADVLMRLETAAVATAELYDHVPTAADPAGDPIDRIGWRRRDPAPLRKVACRPRPAVLIHQGNHDASYGDRIDGQLVIRHFPYRSPEQMTRKARNGGAAYAATDLPEHEGRHWRDYSRLSDEQIADVFRTYFWSACPDRDGTLIHDPCPS